MISELSDELVAKIKTVSGFDGDASDVISVVSVDDYLNRLQMRPYNLAGVMYAGFEPVAEEGKKRTNYCAPSISSGTLWFDIILALPVNSTSIDEGPQVYDLIDAVKVSLLSLQSNVDGAKGRFWTMGPEIATQQVVQEFNLYTQKWHIAAHYST